MTAVAQREKLSQMLKMLIYYRASHEPDDYLAQAIAQVLGLVLLDGCQSFQRFVEKTAKINAKQVNFKLPIFYNQLKQNEQFSASNLVKAYMQNFAFAQLPRDIYGRALPDFYSAESFLLNEFQQLKELFKVCADDDFSSIAYAREHIDLKAMRELLKEENEDFRNFLQTSLETEAPGTQDPAGTGQVQQKQANEQDQDAIDGIKIPGVLKNIGKLFSNISSNQVKDSEKVELPKDEPIEPLLDFTAVVTAPVAQVNADAQLQQPVCEPVQDLVQQAQNQQQENESVQLEVNTTSIANIDCKQVVDAVDGAQRDDEQNIKQFEHINQQQQGQADEEGHTVQLDENEVTLVADSVKNQIAVDVQLHGAFEQQSLQQILETPENQANSLENGQQCVESEVSGNVQVEEQPEGLHELQSNEQACTQSSEVQQAENKKEADSEVEQANEQRNAHEIAEIVKQPLLKISDMFESVLSRMTFKADQTPEVRQTSNGSFSVKDVVDMALAYRKCFGETQEWITLVYTILVRAFAGTRDLRGFIEETCKLRNDNKNFRLKLFCVKEYYDLGSNLQIAQYIIRNYLINYMVQLFYADICSSLIDVYYPPDSILRKDPLSIKEFCDGLASVDFNQYELVFDKTIITKIMHQLRLDNQDATADKEQNIDVCPAKMRDNDFELELELDETDFKVELQVTIGDALEELQDTGAIVENKSAEDEQLVEINRVDGSEASEATFTQSMFTAKSRDSCSFHEPSEIDLQSSTSPSTSEQTLTEQYVESQYAEALGRFADVPDSAISYQHYQKFNNTELFCQEVTFTTDYFKFYQSQHIVEAEKAVSGKKLKTQLARSKVIKQFTVLTQGPLQFLECAGACSQNIIFDAPPFEDQRCGACQATLERDAFYCYNCNAFRCEKHEQLLTILPQFCFLGCFTPFSVCLECYAKIQKDLGATLILDTSLMVQVSHQPCYKECRRLRLILLYLSYLLHMHEGKTDDFIYASDLDYYGESNMEVALAHEQDTFNIALNVSQLKWTFLDVVGFFDGSVRQRLTAQIKTAKSQLAATKCSCGAKMAGVAIGICGSCGVLRCRKCLQNCCQLQKE